MDITRIRSLLIIAVLSLAAIALALVLGLSGLASAHPPAARSAMPTIPTFATSPAATDPSEEAARAIEARYQALGGPTGVLGPPTSAVTPVTGGYFRWFMNGRIYYSTAAGAWELTGVMLDHFLALGGPDGSLGLPTSTTYQSGSATVQNFVKGRVYFTSSRGPHAVLGATLARYLTLGGPSGPLGVPNKGEYAGKKAGVRVTNFQHGRIWYSVSTGAWEALGPILHKYLTIGAESSWIGLPTSAAKPGPNGTWQRFQNATIQYYPAKRAAYVRVPWSTAMTVPTASDLPYTYRSGCPVKPANLRMIRLPFRNFSLDDQYGTIVVRSSVVPEVTAVFKSAQANNWAIRRIVPVDKYKGSDEASMRADNTSAFNCRKVTGNPYRLSQHSYGNAVDINTFENPYVTATKVYPEGSETYLNRNNKRKGMILRGDPVESVFRGFGWPWGARWRYPDYQHFSENGA
ncbi:M15 family metallopeptidase [Actinopolymorpha alba]|uniref:M15 family metallopeptidase n=1 Tax=Actinopolymorpha alba TaxID=533267 RepID=UPI00037AD3F3|nr:M15 family metallopeptidase [Actinopolymorpha alba]